MVQHNAHVLKVTPCNHAQLCISTHQVVITRLAVKLLDPLPCTSNSYFFFFFVSLFLRLPRLSGSPPPLAAAACWAPDRLRACSTSVMGSSPSAFGSAGIVQTPRTMLHVARWIAIAKVPHHRRAQPCAAAPRNAAGARHARRVTRIFIEAAASLGR